MIHWSEEQVYSHYTITQTVQVLQRQDGGLRTPASEKELTGAVILFRDMLLDQENIYRKKIIIINTMNANHNQVEH